MFEVLAIAALVLLVASLPLSFVAIYGYRKRAGEPFLIRTLVFSALNGLWIGLVLAGAGFVFGASVGDENAGDAAVYLAGVGFAAGGLGGLICSSLTISCGCWRLASQAAATDPS